MHYNLDTMTAYRKNMAKRGYNPFDYPEEWEFFKRPFEADEEDDILTNLLFQIRKMSRRLHIYFDAEEYNHLETAFYFGLLDSLSEADDYLLGALKYARYCRLENLFFLAANDELVAFFEKLDKLMDELLSKIRSFGDSIVKLNEECCPDDLFVRQYCYLTQHGIPDDMLQALLRAPGFQLGLNETLKIDDKANFFSYCENISVGKIYKEYEKFIEGAYDSSKLNLLLEPVDWLFYYIRGTLLWVVIKRLMALCSNTNALRYRHNKLDETMIQNSYKEVCGVYARSKAYAKRRDEELPRQCGEEMFLLGRKPTAVEIRTYFNEHYRNYILMHNQTQQLFHQCRNQESTFCLKFINMLFDEETRQDAEDFLFYHTFSKELCSRHESSTNMHKDVALCEVKDQCQLAQDKYKNHFLMKHANKDSRDKVLYLLEDLEKFQVEGVNTDNNTGKYVFDFNAYKKNQIFGVCKDIRGYLRIGKKEFGKYLLENTNLGDNAYSKGKSVTLETILNQI